MSSYSQQVHGEMFFLQAGEQYLFLWLVISYSKVGPFVLALLEGGLSCLIALNSSCFWWLWWIEIPFAKTSKEIDKVVVARVRETAVKKSSNWRKVSSLLLTKVLRKVKVKGLKAFIVASLTNRPTCFLVRPCTLASGCFWKRSFFLLFRKNTHHT